MRIALMPSAYAPAVGGVEELTARLGAELAGRGHQVEIWVNRHPATLPAEETIDGLAVRRFDWFLPSSRVSSVLRIPAASRAALAPSVAAMRRFRPELLHVQCFSVNGVYATALARLFATPLIVSLQGETIMDDHDIYEHSALLRAGLRAGLRTADVITACSQFTLADARRFGLPADRGRVIPNGVAPSEPVEARPLAVPWERFVLALGRVVDKKGFDLLLHAFADVAAADPAVGLVIGGTGPALPRLTELAAELSIGQRVAFPGGLDRGQVAWATAHAAAFALPSRVEPFGIVVLEAMRAGLPVVVSGRGGATEIVTHGVDGLVADPCDRAEFASALRRALAGGPEIARMRERAIQRARDFTWPAITDRYLAAYADAAPARRRP